MSSKKCRVKCAESTKRIQIADKNIAEKKGMEKNLSKTKRMISAE